MLPPWTEVVEVTELPDGMRDEPCVVVEPVEDAVAGFIVERVVTVNLYSKPIFEQIPLQLLFVRISRFTIFAR